MGRDKHNDPQYLGSGTILKNAIKKYGKANFIKSILEETTDPSRESYWIKKCNTIFPNGYNITEGGEGGDVFTHKPEILKKKTRAKLSAASKEMIKKGIGICAKMHKGQHVTEVSPVIKRKWKLNHAAAMKQVVLRHNRGEYTEAEINGIKGVMVRRKNGYYTAAEIAGLQKLRKFWKSKEERERRSKRQQGVNNSRYQGPYNFYDADNNLVGTFNLLDEIVAYTIMKTKNLPASRRNRLCKISLQGKANSGEPYIIGPWKGYTVKRINDRRINSNRS